MTKVDSPLSASARHDVFRFPAADIEAGGPWLFWSAPPSEALRRSLERDGQLVPVLVDASPPRPVLVAGAARLTALTDAGREALCLDLGPLDDLARGLAYARSNLGRELTDGQVVAAMRYFASLPQADPGPALEVLGLEPRSKRLRLVRSWLTLPRHWDLFLNAGSVPLACADLLEGLSPVGLQTLEPLFAGLSWSRGNAVNVLTWLKEACARDGVGVGEILDSCGVGEILAVGLSPKDAMGRITQEVRLRRFPRLSDMERDFSEAARRVGTGTRWRITQPDLFESNAVEFSARPTSPAGLRELSAELARIAARDDLDALFPLEGK
jgi:ParB family chromosome partitioning protein